MLLRPYADITTEGGPGEVILPGPPLSAEACWRAAYRMMSGSMIR